MEFGVVVLNYNDYQSTIKCVWSLLECDPLPGSVVVVDNRSPNESFDVLAREFASFDIVKVFDSGRNGGYAFGNNVGIRYLRERGARHVLIATGDTEVVSLDLFRRLGVAIGPSTGIVAPQILGPQGFQNPSVETLSIKYILDLIWIRNGMPGLQLRRRASQALRKTLRALKRRRGEQPADPRGNIRKVYKLHGAFLCLTEYFLRALNGLDERIFMFGEEDLLAWNCLDHGLDQVLVSDALVRHFDDSSIEFTWGSRSQQFIDDEQRKSGKVLKEAIDIRRLIRFWWTNAGRIASTPSA